MKFLNREYFPMGNRSSPIVLYEEVKTEWLEVWERLDVLNDGKISCAHLESLILETDYADPLHPEAITTLLYKADLDKDGYISKEEFLTLVKETRQSPLTTRLLRSMAFLAVPRSNRNVQVRRYIDEYSCLPPPIFMFVITIAEISAFIYYGIEMEEPISASGPTPFYSPLIYNPKRRYEAWRFLTYIFIHSGWVHLLTNVIMQLFLGIILELVHKWWRVMLIYTMGAIGGCLASSITYPNYFVAGASGGVYALEYAYIGNLILNWSEMSYPIVQVIVLATISLLDVSFAIWDSVTNSEALTISYMGHLGGALVGVLMGVCVLRNLKKEPREKYWWFISFAILTLLMGTAIIVHIAVPDFFPPQDH